MNEMIELKPGQYVAIRTNDNNRVALNYDELVRLFSQNNNGTRRKKSSAASKFSHHVALAMRALDTGMWSTGSKVNADWVLHNLTYTFTKLTPADYQYISPNAINALTAKANQYKSIEELVTIITNGNTEGNYNE
jgi:YD repeat-containing protein